MSTWKSGTEIKELRTVSPENYKTIKPESQISLSEANDFWNAEFKRSKQDFDDNGKLFREADHLLPNNRYEINGYSYTTDEKSRITSAEGKLRIRDDGFARNMEDVRDFEGQEYQEGDERAHLIGHQFGGSDRLENLVPMDAKLNHGDFYNLERKLADAVKDGADVRLKVEPVYESDSNRPTEFKVSYSIDGDRETTVFRNERVE